MIAPSIVSIERKDRAYQGWGWLVAVMLVPACLGVEGKVLSTLWRWFVRSAFPQAPMLSPAQVVGMMILLWLIRDRPTSADAEAWEIVGKQISGGILGPLLYLAIGAVVRAVWL